MTGICDLPRLEIVPVGKLVLHEYHDEQRTPPLINKLRSHGVLRNPPVVIPLLKQQGHYMVLDGANRVSAFREMDIPHILVQVIEPEVDQLELFAWNHVIWGLSPDELFNLIESTPKITLQPSHPDQSFQDLEDIHSLASLHLPDGKAFTAFISNSNLIDRVNALNQLVKCYCGSASSDRTSVFQIQSLCELYDNFAGLVLLPTFEIEEVIIVVEAGHLMPPGSTCFRIAPRALHINYPLDVLKNGISIDRKNADLQNYLWNCLSSKSVRYYAEATILFDE